MQSVDPAIKSKAVLVAEQGWQATFVMHSGEELERAFITATDFDKDAIVVETIGGRSKKPNLFWLKDIKEIKYDWS